MKPEKIASNKAIAQKEAAANSKFKIEYMKSGFPGQESTFDLTQSSNYFFTKFSAISAFSKSCCICSSKSYAWYISFLIIY